MSPGASPASTPAQRLAWPTVLVSMPFLDTWRPSIQLGLLKSIGTAAGFLVVTLHANLDFAARIGPDLYGALCQHRGRQFGDWLFSMAAFGDSAPDATGQLLDDFATDLAFLGPAGRSRLKQVREKEVPGYLDALTNSTAWNQVRLVGFSSTFQQNAASIAFARRLKERFPHLTTVFGGANFDDTMGLELIRTVPAIDLAVLGEGDVAFPAMLDALATGRDPASVPGVARRSGSEVIHTPPASDRPSMDRQPFPVYDEYFERRRKLFGASQTARDVAIPFESGRGCWWGAKHHCTFCGLNGPSLTWRAKSPQRVLDELAHLSARHEVFTFEAVDNILDPGYLVSLLPALAEARLDYEIFYEVKANLTRAQIRSLAESGIRHLQPGIESFSSHVLALMRKGTRSSQNVNLLRWTQHYQVSASWNLLWGFPGETEQDYADQAEVLHHLVHLQPPQAFGRVWLERFSPMFTDPEQFPTRVRRPEDSYRYVYPPQIDLEKVAYFFDYEFDSALPNSAYEPVARALRGWQEAWHGDKNPGLTFRSSPKLVQIDDTRWPGNERTFSLRGGRAAVYRALVERPATAAAVRHDLGLAVPPEALTEMFDAWQQDGLVWRDGDRTVALALPATPLR